MPVAKGQVGDGAGGVVQLHALAVDGAAHQRSGSDMVLEVWSGHFE
jgi:hypothetical protein